MYLYYLSVKPLLFNWLLLDEFKESLHYEIKQWQNLFANGVLESSKLEDLCKFVSEKYSVLALPINDLVDARRVLLCLKEVESKLMDLDHDIENTNEVYDLLTEYGVEILPEDDRRLDLLNDTYRKLKTKVISDINNTQKSNINLIIIV